MSEKTEQEFKSMGEVMHYIQTNIKVPKSQENKFGGYKYRNLEDIKEALKKIMPETAFILEQDEVIYIEGRFYIKATVSFYWGKDVVSTTGYAREEESKKGMDGSQVTGAASSYARKYAYNALFGIDDTKDADSMDNADKNAPQTTVNEVQVNTLSKLIEETQSDLQGFLRHYKIEKLENMPSNKFMQAKGILEGKKAKNVSA
jgi:hypothetical protein